MTRFARRQSTRGGGARGAGGPRQPEEATPWNKMRAKAAPPPKKRKLQESNVEDDNILLDEEVEQGGFQREMEPRQIATYQKETKVESEEDEDHQLQDDEEEENVHQLEEEKEDEKMEYNEAKVNREEVTNAEGEIEGSKKKKKKRSQNKCLNCKAKDHLKMDCPQLSEERRKELQELRQMKIERKGKGTGRKKNKNKNQSETEKTVRPQPTDDRPKKEKKDRSGQVVQEGEGLFHGFRVKKEDVKRLVKIQKKLVSEKTAPALVAEVMKRERRKAEKDLARSKRTVCFNCRDPGHMLADCPSAQAKVMHKDVLHSGQCFKCGSDEHISKECKAKKKTYAYAVCFICGETGHLAKACPDNPRGIYPKGGGCRFCGSVEHLKNDCPRKVEKDSRDEVTVETIGDDFEVEGEISKDNKSAKTHGSDKVKKKVVSF